MALKTNQMQTDLKKYREGWDRIFKKHPGDYYEQRCHACNTCQKVNGQCPDCCANDFDLEYDVCKSCEYFDNCNMEEDQK